MSSQPVLILTTVPSLPEAQSISQALLERRLVACAQILPGIESHYRWEGKLETSSEILLQCKTLSGKQQQVIDAIEEMHSYQVPEIVAIPILATTKRYHDWIAESVLP